MAQRPDTRPGPIRHGPYPELGWPAVLVGWLIGAVLAVSISYASLILGFSIAQAARAYYARRSNWPSTA